MGTYKTFYKSPIGMIEICGTEEGIESILFTDEEEISGECPDCLRECLNQIDEYFKGKRTEFSVKLNPAGTEFQRRVWKELTTVAYGNTVSYKDIARGVGNEKAVRAVGTTNGRNPISIIVPCHRIIGTNGKLTGYAGGLWRKEWLLKHEEQNKNI